MEDTIIALVSGGIGFLMKSIWETYIGRKRERELEVWRIEVAELEKRLSQFYWPIYLRLQRDNVVWAKILERNNQSDDDKRKLGHQIEKDVLLPNHSEIVGIIEKNIHLAASDKSFEGHLLAYLRHVDVYKATRAAGIVDKDPIHFEEPYPAGFFDAVQVHLQRNQKRYDEILSRPGIV